MVSEVPDTKSDIDEPILFRTTTPEVYKNTIETGSVWLRSDRYYRELEDEARCDQTEGVNTGTTRLPLNVSFGGGPSVTIVGNVNIGQMIVPHYILSLHGMSIHESQWRAFGGYTFGIRSLFRLSVDLLFQVSQQLECTGYRYGPVTYQYTALKKTLQPSGGSPIALSGDPPCYLHPYSSDVLRKHPVAPFVEQDEWRIVVFTKGYLSDDYLEPLKLSVSPENFYPYVYDGAP